jgi:hypothetical protein
VYLRGLPWHIRATTRDILGPGPPRKCLAFFLKCKGEKKYLSWNCHATATLKLKSHTRNISHTFSEEENDWGFAQFFACDVKTNPIIHLGTLKFKIII